MLVAAAVISACRDNARPTPPDGPGPAPTITATCRGTACTFTVSETASDVPIVAYRWVWGDGAADTVVATTLSHRYAFPGDFTVAVTATNARNQSGTAERQVVALAEPDGAEVLVDRDWSCAFIPVCDAAWGYSDRASDVLTIRTEGDAPWSPPSVAQMLFAAGHPGGSAPASAEIYFDAGRVYRTLYVALWARFSAGWVGHESGVNKLVYLFDDVAHPRAYLAAFGGGSEPLELGVTLQEIAEPYPDPYGVLATTIHLPPNSFASRPVLRGVWQRFELELTANSPGASDGRVRTWLDGVPLHDYTGIRFANTAQPGWTGLQWAPVWGGVDGVVTTPMTQQFDHLYVSGR